jgi:hypothetical protein
MDYKIWEIQMIARILTENVNFNDIKKLTREYFPSVTYINAEGVWQAANEHSLIIEIDITNAEKQRAEKLAYGIKKLNKQQAVLVQYIQCESKMI